MSITPQYYKLLSLIAIPKPLYNYKMPFDTIFFDLDATLYPESNGLWPAIRVKIDKFMLERMNIPGEDIPNNTFGWGRIDAYKTIISQQYLPFAKK